MPSLQTCADAPRPRKVTLFSVARKRIWWFPDELAVAWSFEIKTLRFDPRRRNKPSEHRHLKVRKMVDTTLLLTSLWVWIWRNREF
jgi:hypothetical protein